jgi:geranylgeranyl pyrophosphate synthase
MEAIPGLRIPDPQLESAVRDDLQRVEAALYAAVASEFPLVHEAARHLVAAGGKRFRPVLTLLAAQFGPRAGAEEIIAASVVVELTHLGTLYHDDVMDEATVRRGADSVNARWGNSLAILTGDFLFARASDVLAGLGPEAVRIQARTFAKLVTGQIRETVGPAPGEDAVEHHLAVLGEKTGSLIATAAELGGWLSGASQAVIAALRGYAETIGVAFQLSDDILDITADAEELGKTPGTDLREGVATLPMLYALASTDPAQARLRELLARPITDDDEHAEALGLLRTAPAIDAARRTMREYADRARADLDTLPDVPARAALATLADFVLTRHG